MISAIVINICYNPPLYLNPIYAPGEDGVLYGVLARLPSIHHILATLFTKINKSCLAPSSWASSLVVLAHKDGDPKDPAMFRMIALTPTMGKIYHQVKAERMAKYMRQWCKSQRFNTIIEYFLLEHPFVNKTWVNR